MKQKYVLPLFNYERVNKSEYNSEKKTSNRKIACTVLVVSTLITLLVLIILIAFNVISLRQKNEHNIIYSKTTTLIECKKQCWHNGTCEIVQIGDLIEFKCICKDVKLLILD